MKSPKHRRKSGRKSAQQDSGPSVNWPWADLSSSVSCLGGGRVLWDWEELASSCSAHS